MNKRDNAIPALEESLSAPTGEQKSKTNVSRFKALAVVLVAFLFLVFGLMLWLRSRTSSSEDVAGVVMTEPAYAKQNEMVEAVGIDGQKAKIREDEEERLQKEARQRAELEEAERRAREEALARALANQARTGLPLGVSEETPEARAMRSGVLLPLTGSPEEGDDSGGGSGETFGISDAERQQREFQARMAGLGQNLPSQGAASMDGDSLGGRLRSSSTPAVAAGHLPNLTYLLKKGSTIPCALKTGIDTQLPGFVLCNVISDVYSANGKTLLIERGATLFGEQQSTLKQGQERTFVIWTRVDNPSGVSANLDSPATDTMGASGIPGIVNNHFMKRFGAAILLSLIKDFSSAAADRYARRRDDGFTIATDSGDEVGSMAEEALRNSINIPPTLVVKPATVVHVLVARDISFENVYELIQ